MSRLTWGNGPHLYEGGVDRGVLYSDGVGIAWNGLISVEEKDSGTINGDFYLDGVRRSITQETGDFEATINAYIYPEEFDQYDEYTGGDINKRFGMSYRTSNELHIVYNALARPSNKQWKTIEGVPDPSVFVWDLYSSAISIPGARPGSHLAIDPLKYPSVTTQVEDILYGTDTTDPRLPTPSEVIDLFEAMTVLKVKFLGDGRWSITGPDDMLAIGSSGTVTVTSPTAFDLSEGRVEASSY